MADARLQRGEPRVHEELSSICNGPISAWNLLKVPFFKLRGSLSHSLKDGLEDGLEDGLDDGLERRQRIKPVFCMRGADAADRRSRPLSRRDQSGPQLRSHCRLQCLHFLQCLLDRRPPRRPAQRNIRT